jgi:hypothetical protein
VKKNPKIFLFLGSHGTTEDIAGITGARSAIIKIKEMTKNIPNKNKILVVECGGWERNPKVGFLCISKDKEKGRLIFNRVINYYKDLIKKFEIGENIEHYDWASLLLKFGVESGYTTILEEPNFNISWKYFIEFGDEDRFQSKRDEIFVNQLIDLKKKYPSKTLVVVRGKKHDRWMPGILNKNNIPFDIIYYL